MPMKSVHIIYLLKVSHIILLYLFFVMNNISLHLELPLPGVKITFNSTTGSGDDSCLGLKFTDSSNSFICMADNAPSNLLHPPMIEILEKDISTNKTSLTFNISNNDPEPFTCRVCINIPEAIILDHCSNESVKISHNGQFTFKKYVSNKSVVLYCSTRSSNTLHRY